MLWLSLKWRVGESVKVSKTGMFSTPLINVSSHVRAESRILHFQSIDLSSTALHSSSLCPLPELIQYSQWTFHIFYSILSLFLPSSFSLPGLSFLLFFSNISERLLWWPREWKSAGLTSISHIYLPWAPFTTCSCCFNIILIKKSSRWWHVVIKAPS